MDASQTTPTIKAPGLGRKIGLAWAAVAWEGLWPRLVPLLSALALFVAAAHLDLFAGLDPWVHTGLLVVLAAAFGGLAWWQLRRFALPARDSAIRRLERGIDVGAKFEIYTIINELAAQGKGIIMISSELPELIGESDRIVVMCRGRLTGIVDRAHADEATVMRLATDIRDEVVPEVAVSGV